MPSVGRTGPVLGGGACQACDRLGKAVQPGAGPRAALRPPPSAPAAPPRPLLRPYPPGPAEPGAPGGGGGCLHGSASVASSLEDAHELSHLQGLPFELRAVEAALLAMVTVLGREVAALEAATNPGGCCWCAC